ncbi:MAG: M28 family peptidase [Bacteroidales bacterium]|nr:M28 family peptidase [Bacteroidales bacterium]
MRYSLIFAFFSIFFVNIQLNAQDSLFFRETIANLASPEFHGRGYAFKGDSIAADYIAEKFKKFNLEKWTPDYYQPYKINMNVFEGDAIVSFGKEFSKPELFENFQIMAYSSSLHGSFKVKPIKAEDIFNNKLKAFPADNNTFVYIDISMLDTKDSMQLKIYNKVIETTFLNTLGVRGYILVSNNLLSWRLALGQKMTNHVTINITKECLPKKPKSISVNVDSRYIENYQTQNVCAYVKGKTYPDSFFVFVAHYDHLGHFGKDYILYGANDNASGTAFIVDLARHYSKPENQPDYSIAFLAVSAEEIGLLGSTYYVENSFFPISNIKTVINFDMVGTGENGITLVCGKAFPEEFKKIEGLNNKNSYLQKVVDREATNNSDHYPFYKEGAMAFFIYAMGNSGRYHHTSDRLENMTLGGYSGLFKLITDYINLYNVE